MADVVIPGARQRPAIHWRLAAVAASVAFLAACGSSGGDDDVSSLQLKTLSNRADLVTDGNVLMEVVGPSSGAAVDNLRITQDGRDITSAFQRRADGRMTGLVTGLATGDNVIEASALGTIPTRLVVTNAPRQGPVYSGAQVKPFYCATPTAQPASGDTPATNVSGLTGQPDANCNIPTETILYYRTTTASSGAGACSNALPSTTAPAANSCWQLYTPGSTPVDMASTTTDNGQTVPFIVRLERGTMNRGIYDMAVLFRPGQPWTATAPQNQWNGKVYYTFGSSTGQPRRQARPQASWSGAEEQLKRGYMWVTNSMSDSARNSNRVMMTETVMMMKEHIGDSYGPIKYTLGTGCSGGSINANQNLSIYPGLLDGVITTCTYPDSETTGLEVMDCTLLVETYQKPAVLNLWGTMGLTQAQINARKAAINGHMDQSACQAWFNLFGSNGRAGLYNLRTVSDQVTGAIAQAATQTNNCELPNSAVYDPTRQAETASLPRCNAWAWGESIWGKVPGTFVARDTRDNVGVQYGLRALMAGTITPEEFVTVNETVGGTDRDSTLRAARSTADVEALDIAYRSGIVSSGRNLAKAPILDLRGWDDSLVDLPPASGGMTGIHHIWYSYAIRDRITRDAGDAGNQGIWRWARGNFSVPPNTLGLDAFNAMDRWLTDLVAAPTTTTLEARVRATRPAGTGDFCILSTDPTQSVRVTDMAVCDADKYLKPSLSPRQVAGGPRSEDVLKCQLKPLNMADYTPVAFTAAQWSRLQAVFSTGVCDWTKAGVGQQASVGPLTFRNGPGGVPLGDAPVSR